MSANITAERSGTFRIGGQWAVHRLGFGSMRLTGRGIWGPPANPTAALSTLKRLPELGVNFIDTADSYGPDHAEEQIRAALHPYSGALIATKAGLARTGPDKWVPLGRPEYLIQQAFTSCHRLGLEQIGLWQLHRIDPKVPRGEQFGAVKHLIDSGIIRHAGLSEVSVADIEEASKVFPVATVQNRYNLTDRHSEDVLVHCERHGIGFIPWFPLAAGNLLQPDSRFAQVAKRLQCSPGQLALAWLLRRSPVILPIPGTSSPDHLQENVAAAGIELSDQDFQALTAAD
jgi:aryl-alcohol dehydrogenase-like predicted oxidoreductase